MLPRVDDGDIVGFIPRLKTQGFFLPSYKRYQV